MYIEALHKRIIARHLSGKAGLEPLNTDSIVDMNQLAADSANS